MQDEMRNNTYTNANPMSGLFRNCGCNNNGNAGCSGNCSGDSTILFFLIIFLLLFTNCGCGNNNGCGCCGN